jgi:hypothetical protein
MSTSSHMSKSEFLMQLHRAALWHRDNNARVNKDHQRVAAKMAAVRFGLMSREEVSTAEGTVIGGIVDLCVIAKRLDPIDMLGLIATTEAAWEIYLKQTASAAAQ